MKILKASSQYKKDYKRFRNNPKKIEALNEILKKLANEEPIPEKHSPHMLTLYVSVPIPNYSDSLQVKAEQTGTPYCHNIV